MIIKKLSITLIICAISLCVIVVAGCSIKEEDKNNDLGSGDFSRLPVSIKVLVEHAEYCKEIYDGGGDQRDDVAFDVKQKDGKSIIIIRGTANASNVESDVNIELVVDMRSGIYLHKGFRDAAVTIMEIIDTATKTGRTIVQGQTLQYPLESTVHVTGHSLGGAVAQIIGIWLHKRGKNVQVFSYGSPKISSYGSNDDRPRHWRVVRSTDPVPFTPPLPYVHRGVFINGTTGDWGSENDRGLLSGTDVTDHAIAGYVTTLKYLE